MKHWCPSLYLGEKGGWRCGRRLVGTHWGLAEVPGYCGLAWPVPLTGDPSDHPRVHNPQSSSLLQPIPLGWEVQYSIYWMPYMSHSKCNDQAPMQCTEHCSTPKSVPVLRPIFLYFLSHKCSKCLTMWTISPLYWTFITSSTIINRFLQYTPGGSYWAILYLNANSRLGLIIIEDLIQNWAKITR